MIRPLVWFSSLFLAGCLGERTYVMCRTCKKEPYIAVSELTFATRWGAACVNREAQPVECAHSDYDVDVRCTAPCKAGDCEVPCQQREREPGITTVFPSASESTARYTGPIAVEVTLRKHGTDRSFRYRSPTIWFSGEAMVLVCLDGRAGAVHPMVPCQISGVSARDPLFAIAYEREQRVFSTEPTWHFVDRALVNEAVVIAERAVAVGDLEVPLFRLADVFPQLRTPGGRGLKPARYTVSVATLGVRPRVELSVELDVR